MVGDDESEDDENYDLLMTTSIINFSCCKSIKILYVNLFKDCDFCKEYRSQANFQEVFIGVTLLKKLVEHFDIPPDDVSIVAISCLFLAFKITYDVSGSRIKLSSILRVTQCAPSLEAFYQDIKTLTGKEVRNLVFQYELQILYLLDFVMEMSQLNFDREKKYLREFCDSWPFPKDVYTAAYDFFKQMQYQVSDIRIRHPRAKIRAMIVLWLVSKKGGKWSLPDNWMATFNNDKESVREVQRGVKYLEIFIHNEFPDLNLQYDLQQQQVKQRLDAAKAVQQNKEMNEEKSGSFIATTPEEMLTVASHISPSPAVAYNLPLPPVPPCSSCCCGSSCSCPKTIKEDNKIPQEVNNIVDITTSSSISTSTPPPDAVAATATATASADNKHQGKETDRKRDLDSRTRREERRSKKSKREQLAAELYQIYCPFVSCYESLDSFSDLRSSEFLKSYNERHEEDDL